MSNTLNSLDLYVDRLGHRGDGLSSYDGHPVYIDGALPGETVRILPGERKAKGFQGHLKTILQPSPDRIVPPCPMASVCGGCSLQHASEHAESAWKHSFVTESLARCGLDVPVHPVINIPCGTRRRACLSWKKSRAGFSMGYNARASHTVIHIEHCMLLTSELNSCLRVLHESIRVLAPTGSGNVYICDSDNGIDVLIEWPKRPSVHVLEVLAGIALEHNWARLCLRVEGIIDPVAVLREPVVSIGKHSIHLPSGAFLQPSREGQSVLISLVSEAVSGCSGPVIDLFCGLGTFALPLSDSLSVTAFDCSQESVQILARTGRVRAGVRDLFRNPVTSSELEGYRVIVLDPPRAGGASQVHEIAKTCPRKGPGRVIMVSCNPATFSRDARLLVDSGFMIEKITPVNQFSRSSHVELVAVFLRVQTDMS